MQVQFTRTGPNGQAPLADARGNPVEVKRYPTRLQITCPGCGHAAVVALMLADVAKLRCSRCGCADPIIAGREPLRTWARSRRKQNCSAKAPVSTRPRAPSSG